MRTVVALVLGSVLTPSLAAQLIITGNGYLVVPRTPGFGLPLPAQGCTQATIPPWNISSSVPPCGTLGPIGVPVPDERFGDFAVNRMTDELWVTDGNTFASYSLQTSVQVPPVMLRCFTLPGWGRGMGCQAGPLGTEVLWLTNGTNVRGVIPPVVPGGAVANVTSPAGFPVATLPPTAVINDLDYDSTSGTLWVGDSTGTLREVLIGGAPGPNAPFVPSTIGGGICGTTTPPAAIVGVAVETTATAGTVLIVAEGLVKRFLPTGVLAPPEPYATPCVPLSSYQAGIAFAPRPVPLSTVAGASNQIGAFLAAGPGIVATHTFAPGAVHVLVASALPLCPPQQLPNSLVTLYLNPSLMVVVGFAAPPPGVPASVPLAYPPIPPGLTLFLQWAVIDQSGALSSSDAGQITSSR